MYFTWEEPLKENGISSNKNNELEKNETINNSTNITLPEDEIYETIVKNFVESIYNRDYITMYYLFDERFIEEPGNEPSIPDLDKGSNQEEHHHHDDIFSSEEIAAELGRAITRNGKIKDVSYNLISPGKYNFEIIYTDFFHSSFIITLNKDYLIDVSLNDIYQQIQNNLTDKSSSFE
jgi:hypothetical protein